MHKWHVHAALGRSRPSHPLPQISESIALSLRQFHISALRAEGEAQQAIPSNRARRQQTSNQEIQNLVSRTYTAARPQREDRQSNTGFRSINLSQTDSRPPLVDLRSLAARSSSTGQSPRPLDARSLGARPQNRPHGAPQSIGLRGGFRGGSGVGVRGGGFRGGRGARGGAVGRGRGGLRGRGRGGPKRSRGNTGPGEGGFTVETIEKTPEEIVYMTEKTLREKAVPIPYDLVDVSKEALVGKGPAVIVGQWGMSELVEDTLNRMAPVGLNDAGVRRQDLARELLRGSVVRFKDEEEKNGVLSMAESIATKDAELKSEKKGELIESKFAGFEPFSEDWKFRFSAKMLKGEYDLTGNTGKEGDPQDLLRNTRRNETYLPKDGDSLAARVRSLLAAPSNRPRVKKTA